MAAATVNFINHGHFKRTNVAPVRANIKSRITNGRCTADSCSERKATTPILDKSDSDRRCIGTAVVLLLALTGCRDAFSYRYAGAFFPDWILCSLVGIAFSVIVYRLSVVLKIDADIQPALLIYPNIALSCSLTLWLLFFG